MVLFYLLFIVLPSALKGSVMGSVQCMISFVLAVGGFEKILYNTIYIYINNYECGNNFLNIQYVNSHHFERFVRVSGILFRGLLSLFAQPPNHPTPQLHLPVQHSPTTMTLHYLCPRCLQLMLCFWQKEGGACEYPYRRKGSGLEEWPGPQFRRWLIIFGGGETSGAQGARTGPAGRSEADPVRGGSCYFPLSLVLCKPGHCRANQNWGRSLCLLWF